MINLRVPTLTTFVPACAGVDSTEFKVGAAIPVETPSVVVLKNSRLFIVAPGACITFNSIAYNSGIWHAQIMDRYAQTSTDLRLEFEQSNELTPAKQNEIG
jgi:hypothetical protein